MQHQLQYTPAMIFVDLAQYPSPPSTASAEDCLSAVLSSPSISGFDELSPYPAPPSTASIEVSARGHPIATTSASASSSPSAALSSCLPAPSASSGLTVNIPAPGSLNFFDMAAQYPTAPPSAGTDASYSSFSTASPALPMYSVHPPLPASGCLYEAAAMAQAISPQSTYPAQFTFRAPYPAMLPINNAEHAFFPHGLPTPIAEHGYSAKPVSSFQFNTPSAPQPAVDLGTPELSEALPISQPAPISSFVTGAMHSHPFATSPIPTPEFLAHIPRGSAPMMPFPTPAALATLPPSLVRPVKEEPQQLQLQSQSQQQQQQQQQQLSADLNLYDASNIRNSGVLFASNGRILLACSFCKLRKLRCNGGTPGCSQCTKRGLCCSYPTTIRRRGKAKRKTVSSTDGSSSKDASSPAKEGDQDDEDEEDDVLDYSSSSVAAGKGNSRSASEEPDVERSRKRKGTAFGSEPLLAPAFKKRSQSCHGTETATLVPGA
ncbi:hypothetical protein OC842_000271 [Tilletia horrida]|uniref:Zn(2)-C6 fungal-type domain-containing protein n=1 Tax=Tilletia horrida TaxID=155126 RepID=A0AAN6GHT8_9BASI|nr:hypothetical protein OC842_000271 [Tilletia horrida]